MTNWHEIARRARENRDANELAERDARAGVELVVEGDALRLRAQSRVCLEGPHVGTCRVAKHEYGLATLRACRCTAAEVLALDLRATVLVVQPQALPWIVARVQEALRGMSGFVRWPDPTLAE